MDTMLTDGVSRQKTEFPAKKPGLMVLFPNTNVNGKSKSYASKQTVTKIGESGLALNHFELSFKRGGFEGRRVLLSELNTGSMGKPRVTKSKMIIKNLSAYFEKQNVNVK